MTYEEFDKRCDELENAPLPERKTFFADVLAGETEKTDVRMMAYFRYALLLYREGDFRTAREILEPFIIDYKSYRYRPEIIACFNLVGVVAYYVQEYALSRFYIHEGLKIAREHSEVSRYAYEYNNLAVTYLAQQDYGKALEAIREAEKNMPVSDEVMHAYIYRNLAEICCHLDRLDEAKDALAKCLAYRGREILPEEVRIVNTLLTYKAGDTAGYKRCCAELREHLPRLHAQEFLASCKVLFDCGMDAGDNAQVEWVLNAMDAYLRRDPKEAQVGLRAETCRYEYAKATGNTALMLAALEKKETYYALVLARKEEIRVRDAGRYLHIGQQLQNALESEASANRTKTRFLANMSHDIRTPINGILGMLEVIRDCRSDEARVDDCLGKIDISAKHLLSLVNDVLDMSKIESNSFVVEAKPFNLGRTLAEVDDIVRFQAEQSGLRLYTDHDDVHDADLLGGALYLKKILVNLYSNAIKYNKPGGSITTRLAIIMAMVPPDKMPFPPLKWNIQGNMCPSRQNRPPQYLKNTRIMAWFSRGVVGRIRGSNSPPSHTETRMATMAFSTSVRMTTTVSGPPKVRKKLVSPALPLPWFLTSSRRIYLETITAPLKQPQK